MKKSLTAAIAVAVLGASALIASPAYALDEHTIAGIEYELDAGEARVIDHDGDAGSVVVIPSTIRVDESDYRVVAIDDEGLDNKDFTSVTIPASVTRLGKEIFHDDARLEVTFLGAVPTDIRNGHALGKSDEVTVMFSAEFGSDSRAGGFTTPTWLGYASSAADSNPETQPEAQPQSSTSKSTVGASVVAGPRTAALSALQLPSVVYSHVDQTVASVASVTVTDLSDSDAGWTVTQQASDLSWATATDGPGSGTDLSAANLSIESRVSVTAEAGQRWNGTEAINGSLNEAVTVMTAPQGEGSGRYTAALRFLLTIPAETPVGTYTGTLTTTVAVAPE